MTNNVLVLFFVLLRCTVEQVVYYSKKGVGMKQFKVLLIAAFCVLANTLCIHTRESVNEAKKNVSLKELSVSSDSRQEEEIQELIAQLEVLLKQEPTRGATKESSSIILETIKKIFSKLKKLRNKVKSHEEQIVAAKEGLDSVSAALGNPAMLEKLSDGADSAFNGIVKIDARVVAQAKELQLLKQEMQPKIDLMHTGK